MSHRTTSIRGSAAAAAVGAALIAATLAGCATGPVPDPTEPTRTPAPLPTSTRTPTPVPTVQPDADQAACLVGDWVVDEQQLNTFFDAVETENAGSVQFEATGQSGLSFDGARYSYTPDISLAMRIADVTGTGTIAGTVTGDYAVDGENLSTSNDTSDIDPTITVGGMPMSATELFDPAIFEHPIADGPFVCGAGLLVVQFSTGSGSVPLTLHH
ncbi:MAG: hypothetical protein J0G30_02150 [Actinomycetales bacterium]|nr:hypothetical protein [Actinomycetales bacterium]